MNYFRCGGSEKVTIDGEKVKDKMELKSFVSDSVRVSTLPYNFNQGSAVVLNGEIHILGNANQNHYKWDGSAWTEVSTLPYFFECSIAVVLNDEIHLMNGYSLGRNFNHYKWDGSVWTKLEDLPTYDGGRPTGISAVVLNGEIHLLGGYDIPGKRPTYFHYKWDGTSWTKLGNLPYAFAFGSAVVLNDKIHILGGSNKLDMGNDYTTEYKYHYMWDGETWTNMGDIPKSYARGQAVVLDDKIHILGGAYGSGGTWYGRNYHYKWNGTSWDTLNTLVHNFFNGSAVVLDEKINLLGGESQTSSSSTTTFNYFLKSHECVGAKVYTT